MLRADTSINNNDFVDSVQQFLLKIFCQLFGHKVQHWFYPICCWDKCECNYHLIVDQMSSTFSDAKTQGEVSTGTYKDTVSKITILVPTNTSQINGITSQLKVIPKIKPHKLTTLKGY